VSDPASQKLEEAIDGIGARRVECCTGDFSSNARGKTLAREDFLAQGGCRMASVVLGLTLTGASPPRLFGALLPSSYRDVVLRADPATLMALPGRAGVATVLCEPHGALRAEESGREFDANALSPRAALRRVLANLARAGLGARVAPELEFCLVRRQPGGPAHEIVSASATPGSPAREMACEADSVERSAHFAPYFDALFQACEQLRIPVTGYAHESSWSQYEVNFRPGEPLAQADAVFRFKRLAREVAVRHGFLASFIAKPFLDQPGAGMHWHFSLQRLADGRNAFLAQDSDGDGPHLRQFVGGLQWHAAAATAVLAPYDNSYDRIVRSDASPSKASWGLDDRSVAFRIPASSPSNRRVENRLAGADANPYLVLATTLGLGLAGIENNWEPAPTAADLPRSLPTALNELRGSELMRSILGDELVDLFCAIKGAESQERNACADPRADWDLLHLPEQA